MENQFDWLKLGFNYTKTDYRYISYFKDGSWDKGSLVTDNNLLINESSTCLHYGQQAFEGLKAYRRKDGGIQLFRPDENAKRLRLSCRRLLMPEVSEDQFIDACKQVVLANERFLAPYGAGSTLYIRPFIIGVGENIGAKPSSEYIFCVFCMPVSNYFKGGLQPVNFLVTDYDRAAPMGTGGVKVGGNYAASFYPHKLAKDRGFQDCIYLDPLTHTKIEEIGTSNFFGITHDNQFMTPKSPSILPSITKYSLMQIAKEYLNLDVLETDVYIDKLDIFKEAAACGTAAVITPIGGIEYNDEMHIFYSQTEAGPITKELYRYLTGFQNGDLEAPKGWIYKIK